MTVIQFLAIISYVSPTPHPPALQPIHYNPVLPDVFFLLQLSTFDLQSVSLTPFPATLTSHLQRHEKSATLSLAFATLTSRVKHKSSVCHSYKKHPGSHLSSQRSFRSGFSRPNFLPTHYSPVSTISFTIRTYEKPTCKPLGIRTSKTQDLKPFRMNTSEKTPRGEGTSFQPLSTGWLLTTHYSLFTTHGKPVSYSPSPEMPRHARSGCKVCKT